MLKLSTSSQYLRVPVTAPVSNPAVYPVSVALRLESLGGEPADGDYKIASWVGGEATLLVRPGDYADGQYLCFIRIQADPEDVRLLSGRVRIGDTRT